MDNNALRLAMDDNAEQACFFSLMRPDMSICIKKPGLVPGSSHRAGFYTLNRKFPARCFHTLRNHIHESETFCKDKDVETAPCFPPETRGKDLKTLLALKMVPLPGEKSVAPAI